MMRIALHGAGRMASAVMQAATSETNVDICAVVALDPPAWDTAVPYYPALDQLEQLPDVLIDFSLPDGTVAAAEWCMKSGVALLSGVTGLHNEAQEALKKAAQKVPVLWSPNMSLGVNLLAQLCAHAAAVLPSGATIVIEDLHHQWKKDAPSGTALMLGQSIERELLQDANRIEYISLREGDAIGRHKVTFHLAGEQLEFSHDARDRAIFARGAIAAAQWLNRQAPGRYTAADWLRRR